MQLFRVEIGSRANGREEYGPRRGRIRGLYNKLRYGRYPRVLFDVAEYERRQAGRKGIKPLSNPGFQEVNELQHTLILATNPKFRVTWHTDGRGIRDDLDVDEAELERIKEEIKTDLGIAVDEAIKFQEFMQLVSWE